MERDLQEKKFVSFVLGKKRGGEKIISSLIPLKFGHSSTAKVLCDRDCEIIDGGRTNLDETLWGASLSLYGCDGSLPATKLAKLAEEMRESLRQLLAMREKNA